MSAFPGAARRAGASVLGSVRRSGTKGIARGAEATLRFARRGRSTLVATRLLAMAGVPALAQDIDREFVLEASMVGYRGVGGDIDGVRNPVLRAAPGERVRITIVGVEVLPHDIALEKLGAKSAEVAREGDRASLTFVMDGADNYYCTIPGHRATMNGTIEPLDAYTSSVESVAPEGNLGFESGDLTGWRVEGLAFGDGAMQRAGDDYWVTSGDTLTYVATGMLTSAPFTVTQPFASFRVGGGALKDTRVELVRAADDSVIFEISGYGRAGLRPVVVDLTAEQGKQIYVRLVDKDSGISNVPYVSDQKLAFISFDALRLHPTRPSYPNELKPEEIQILPPLDDLPEGGYSGEEAVAAMTLPEGFTVSLAAAEPGVVRPIAFTTDDRGRLWVVEAMTYPVRAPEGEGRDRILIFDDQDGDGFLETRKVFMEGLNLVSGIEVGFGGVWLGAAPNLLFVPIDSTADRPAGPPRVMLDGWGYEDTHETLNSFSWGPDGWLYGTHGVFTHSKVGKPGTPEEDRVPLNAGVWRYHPQTGAFEVFAEGGSNPWGLDFDDYGQAFMVGCVIPHLFHVVQGAHYHRQSGKHFNPFVFDDIKTHGDHVHWLGSYGPHAGNNRSGPAGGGHAHAGGMFYLGGSWPEEYRNRLFMNNIHGARTNTDIVERQGSGYVGRHGPDFLLANDSWSQFIDLQYGPDGSVWVIDWYDRNQCHSPNPELHDHTHGRIFRVAHANDRPVRVDLQRMGSLELVELQLHENDWYVRHARRILQERGPDRQVHAALKRILRENPDVTRRLRALWALHVTAGLSERELAALLDDRDEYVRAWAVQLLGEDGAVPERALRAMTRLAGTDSSAMVRMYLASAMQRLPEAQRWETVAALAARAEDAGDHNLPLMVWWAAEPLGAADPSRSLGIALESELPRLLEFTVKRVAAVEGDEPVRALATALARTTDPARRRELLKGLNEAVDAPSP